MKIHLSEIHKIFVKNVETWVVRHYLQIAIFNLVIILLFLLRSAGYFVPYFEISVNLIAFIAFLFLILLFGARSKVMFIVFLFFWVFASFLRLLGIEIWAERTAVYTYQALVLGTIMLIYEGF